MLSPKVLVDFLLQNNISFFSGVPDSLLKDFCAYVDDEFPESRHIIAANEGAAVGLGVLFSGIVNSMARNPSMSGELRAIAFLYFALVEATGLFGLVVAFLILFAF